MTEKQRAFCRYVVEGRSAKEAYAVAYQSKGSDATQYVEGSKLLRKPEIQAEIERIRKPLEDDIKALAMSEREKQIAFINERIQACLEKDDETNCRQYTDMLNKILGLYKDSDNEGETKNTLEEMDTAALQRLISVS